MRPPLCDAHQDHSAASSPRCYPCHTNSYWWSWAEVLGPLTLTSETRMDFLAPGAYLAQPKLLQALKTKFTDRWYLFLSSFLPSSYPSFSLCHHTFQQNIYLEKNRSMGDEFFVKHMFTFLSQRQQAWLWNSGYLAYRVVTDFTFSGKCAGQWNVTIMEHTTSEQ